MQTEIYIAAALQAFGLSREDLMGRSKEYRFTRPRTVLMWRLMKRRHTSLPRVGKIMDGRDHTTVLSARRKVDDKLEAGDPIYIEMVAKLEAELIKAATDIQEKCESLKAPPEQASGPQTKERAICFPLSREITPRVYVDRYGAGR